MSTKLCRNFLVWNISILSTLQQSISNLFFVFRSVTICFKRLHKSNILKIDSLNPKKVHIFYHTLFLIMNYYAIFAQFFYCFLCEAHLHLDESRYVDYDFIFPGPRRIGDFYEEFRFCKSGILICKKCYEHTKNKLLLKHREFEKKYHEADTLYYEGKEYFEVVVNGCYGGFSLSDEGEEYLIHLARENGMPEDMIYYLYIDYFNGPYSRFNYKRHDPLLVQTVRDLDKYASGPFSLLYIIKIPIIFINSYRIDEYDGIERAEYDISSVISSAIKNINDDISPEDSKKLLLDLHNLYKTYSYTNRKNIFG